VCRGVKIKIIQFHIFAFTAACHFPRSNITFLRIFNFFRVKLFCISFPKSTWKILQYLIGKNIIPHQFSLRFYSNRSVRPRRGVLSFWHPHSIYLFNFNSIITVGKIVNQNWVLLPFKLLMLWIFSFLLKIEWIYIRLGLYRFVVEVQFSHFHEAYSSYYWKFWISFV
jgi:hypothetical protein